MEIRRVILNKKSIVLCVLFFISNIVYFNFSILNNYQPVSETNNVNYGVIYEKIQNNIVEYSNIPIFQDDDNLLEGDKILDDYGKIRNVQGEAYESGISLWFKSSVQNYMSVILCVLVIFISFETENKGMFPVIYATAGGRGKVALSHLISVFLTAVISSFIFNSSLIIAGCIKTGGVSVLSAPVQLSRGLENVILSVNGIQFFLLVVLISSGAIFLVAQICMLIMYLIHNRKIALTVCGIMIVCEYIIAGWLPAQSKFSIIKYINIATLLDLKTVFTKYQLYVIAGKCFELKELICFVIFIAILVLSVLSVIIKSKKYPFYKKSLLEVVGEKLCCYAKRIVCGLSGTAMEVYKMLIPQRGGFVLLFFILILVKGLWKPVSPGEQLTLGSTEEYMADYYEEWTGPLNEEVFKDIESRSKQLELLIDDNNPAAGYYANGLKAIGERIEYIRANSNRNLWLVNPSGYEYMIGDKGRGISEMSFLIALVGLATIIASVFSYEKKSDMEVLINTTGNGRKSVKKRKYIIVVILCIIMWLIISGMEIYTVTKTYKLSGLQAPVQSLSFMENIPINISIGGYMCIAYIYRLIVMLLSETIFIVVSEKVNNQEVCLLLCGVVILPAVLSLIGMEYLSVISVTHWIRLI